MCDTLMGRWSLCIGIVEEFTRYISPMGMDRGNIGKVYINVIQKDKKKFFFFGLIFLYFLEFRFL